VSPVASFKLPLPRHPMHRQRPELEVSAADTTARQQQQQQQQQQ
jgi:hypothetical protein